MIRFLTLASLLVLALSWTGCGGGGQCLGTSTLCGTSCTNLQSDNLNCGTCVHACGAGQACVSGACTGGNPGTDGGADSGMPPGSDAGADAGSRSDAGATDAFWPHGYKWALETSHMLANYQVTWLE